MLNQTGLGKGKNKSVWLYLFQKLEAIREQLVSNGSGGGSGGGVTSVALTDASGTTDATPSTSTSILAADPDRQYIFIQNIDSANIHVNFGAAATEASNSISITPGSSFVMEASVCTNQEVFVISGSASQKFVLKWA